MLIVKLQHPMNFQKPLPYTHTHKQSYTLASHHKMFHFLHYSKQPAPLPSPTCNWTICSREQQQKDASAWTETRVLIRLMCNAQLYFIYFLMKARARLNQTVCSKAGVHGHTQKNLSHSSVQDRSNAEQ